MSYTEWAAPADLSPWVACTWRSRTTGGRVLPDGCADIVWNGSRLEAVGPATRPSDVSIPAGLDVFGVRFRVGAAGAGFGVPAEELLDSSVALEEVWGRPGALLGRRVEAGAGPEAVLDELRRRRRRELSAPDSEVRAAILGVRPALGERQLRRRFAASVGLRPSVLAGVLRFQRFLALAGQSQGEGLARLAAEAGYADQAHLSRESRRLAGVPPSLLVGAGAHAASEADLLSLPA